MATQEGAFSSACIVNHDGCVVCSDAGIPLRVVALTGDDALCEDSAGTRVEVAVELVVPVREGEILLTHGGVAIGRVSMAEEEREGLDEVRR